MRTRHLAILLLFLTFPANQVEPAMVRISGDSLETEVGNVVLSIYGDIAEREVLVKYAPFDKELFGREGFEGKIVARVRVLADGSVDRHVTLEMKTDNEDINELARQCVLLFQFEAMKQDVSKYFQEGHIEFDFQKRAREERRLPESDKNTFQIFGLLKDRPRLETYMPKYPRWAEEQGYETDIELHFDVLPNGRVSNVVETGKQGRLEPLCARALRAFKFTPLPPHVRQETQHGVLIFKFRLSK